MKDEKPVAVALHYDGTSAPRVTASGKGVTARQIIATAKEHGIPLEKDEELTRLLSNVQIRAERNF